jgi:RNase P subunit RPR2
MIDRRDDMTQTDFDFPARPKVVFCNDCHEWEPIEEYLLLEDGTLVGLCYECAHKRRVDIAKRIGKENQT